MKKAYTTRAYKAKHKRRCKKQQRTKSKKLVRAERPLIKASRHPKLKPPVTAPPDLRLVNNLAYSLRFFKRLRQTAGSNLRDGRNFLDLSMKHVRTIDYASISFLRAILDDLVEIPVDIYSILPDDDGCHAFMADSGFLDKMQDTEGNSYPVTRMSERITFSKSSGHVSREDILKITQTLQKAWLHLSGGNRPSGPVKAVMLEICNNAVEWAGTRNKQWLMGVKYKPDKVIFTITDIGHGILKTLHRQFWKRLRDIVELKPAHEILLGAFGQEYGSSSLDRNRNNGLPLIKKVFDQGILRRLKVITNNVILHFDEPERSRTIIPRHIGLRGTIYQWELDTESINNLQNFKYDDY